MVFTKKFKILLSLFLLISALTSGYRYAIRQPMVLIDLPGAGLGNQLFFYAAAYSLAQRLDARLILLDNYPKELNYTDPTQRSFGLHNFNMQYEKVMSRKWLKWFKRLFKVLYVKETNFFDLKKGDADVYLVGCYPHDYYESEIFFEPYKHNLRQTLKHYPPLAENSKLQEVLNQIWNLESVAIHIRRGDFVGSPLSLGENALQYYEEAISLMDKKLRHPVFFVFSDDAAYVKEQFKDRPNFVIVSQEGNSSIEEFYLMANCKHMITANSTFSWWAAYLNRNPNKIIMTPFPKYGQKRYVDVPLYKKYIYQGMPYPADWLRVDSHFAEYARTPTQ